MTADDPRPAGEATDGRCNDALHTRGGTLLCSRPAGHFMPHRTASEHTSWSHAGSVECSFRPAASGGATDREREDRTLVPICSACVALTDGGWQCDPARLACPYWPTGDSDPAPLAPQADGELRDLAVKVWTAFDSSPDKLAALMEALAPLLADAAAVQRVRSWVASMDDLARQYDEAAAAVSRPELIAEAREHAEDIKASADGVRRALGGGAA